MTKPKIVFFDIDDTLYDQNKLVPDSTAEAIKKLQEQGVITAIATGRSPFMFRALRSQLDIHSFVSINGSYVVHNDKPVYTNPLAADTLGTLVSQTREIGWSLAFVTDKSLKMDGEPDDKARASIESLKLPVSFPESDPHFFENHEVYQGLLFYSDHDEAGFLRNEPFNRFRYVRWHKYGVDVIPRYGSKAEGIKQLLKQLNLTPDEACAFGDGNNDIEMLSYVGTGIAMGNAVDEAKKSADLVTTSVHQDGIYNGLKQVGLL
ncbi:Cof-type HAD-IIB family hydrolase [Sporolactobacillus shoreicorticis]|uniref:Cof-type HAD-IIB family hydrolase n=1 Tax=Sporolactobacillus shoreicorticis TaxID=1923877 RepID=A0ABW5S4R6_9BACL|nr:Cof-type HAD-IIB family hydrolase [Sporolactobacillus shoreicorticis]MCO7126258.1 Cof-type HAD-IIB family hydrolase [Sporolactobacillus shoreicorticis]